MNYLVTFFVKDVTDKKKQFGIVPVVAVMIAAHNHDELLSSITHFFKEHTEIYCASILEETDEEKNIWFDTPIMIVNKSHSLENQKKNWSLTVEVRSKEIKNDGQQEGTLF